MDQGQWDQPNRKVRTVERLTIEPGYNKIRKPKKTKKSRCSSSKPQSCCASPGCNNCKICFQPVNEKTGIQCCGACGTWVHFLCLGYTPGKIKDILDGLIRVKCPCPDCTMTEPREFLVVQNDHIYTCSNKLCPANRPKICLNKNCPSNKDLPKDPNDWPTLCCNKGLCKRFLAPTPCDIPLIPGRPLIRPHVCPDPNEVQCPVGCEPTGQAKPEQPVPCTPCSSSTESSGSSDVSCVMEQLTNTVGELTNELNELMTKMKETVTAATENPCCNKSPCNCPGNPKAKKHKRRRENQSIKCCDGDLKIKEPKIVAPMQQSIFEPEQFFPETTCITLSPDAKIKNIFPEPKFLPSSPEPKIKKICPEPKGTALTAETKCKKMSHASKPSNSQSQ